MKKITLFAALAFSLPVHAVDLATAIRRCQSFSSAGDFVSATAISAKPLLVKDGISYFETRPGFVFSGFPVLAVFAYGAGLRGPRPDPAFGYGVVLEGTTSAISELAEGSSAQVTGSPVKLDGHEFAQIGCHK